ncbi:MAG: SusC/RagA family TonB-linked outer membrane protein [Prevotella sp.]|nr:SusC/RagA family TonB-linked outer membrane protein [Prevotella sp.]
MKYKDKCFLLTAIAAAAVLPGFAQELETETGDSVANLVPVAFQRVNVMETLGGVSMVDMQELTKKNYNTYSLDNLQGYVGGWNGNSLWGMDDRLILVDGVPRDQNNVKADEIDKITFLKGAQAVVLYGSRAAKGVLLITTKRGQISPLQVKVRANTGWNVAKSYPEYIGSAEYMSLYNEALSNDGLAPLYSEEQIYNYGSGSNPYRYPNVNFYSSDYLRKSYNRSDVNAEISGGGRLSTYYANIGYYRNGDYLKVGEADKNYTQRFNVRGNVDFNITDWMTAFVNANVSFYDQKSPVGANYWQTASTFRPNRVSPLIPLSYVDPNAKSALTMLSETQNIFDGAFLGGTQSDLSNVFASYYAGGKSTYTSRQFQFDAGVNVMLDKVLKGLSFHTQFSVDYATSYSTSYNNQFATYEPIWSNYGGKDVIVELTKYSLDKKSGVQNISGSASNQVMNFNAHFDYKNTFNGLHNVSAMLLANGFQITNSGEYHKTSNANLGLQLSYNYAHKYFADFSGAAIHSARLAPGHREAFSPSLSLGWNIAREDAMQGSIFNDLLLSVSGSVINTDMGIDEYYMYAGNYSQTSAYWWGWRESVSLHPTVSNRGANEDLTFLKRKELSFNLKAALFDKALTADLSFFINSMEGKIISPNNQYPNYFFTYYPDASFIPYTNYDNDRRTGFDFALNYKKQFGKFYFTAGVTGTYYATKATKRDDSNFTDTYQYRQGKPIDALWGYEAIGFFANEDDITNSPSQSRLSGNIKPGDIKYKDQNGDNYIDNKDQVNLGRGGWYGSPFTLGINLTAKYEGFTLFVLGTGGWGGKAFTNNSYYWIDGEDKYSAVVRNRWTPETASTATYPRLTTGNGVNNLTNSNFWIYSTDQFNLSKVQLTYDFPQQWFRGNGFVHGLSAYVSGNNLLKIAKNREILELNVTSAPQSRFYNLGVQVTF